MLFWSNPYRHQIWSYSWHLTRQLLQRQSPRSPTISTASTKLRGMDLPSSWRRPASYQRVSNIHDTVYKRQLTIRLGGKAYKYFPLKPSFLLAMFIFEVGSLICGVAPNSKALIVGRAITGVGAAGLGSGAYTIVGFSTTPAKRPLLMGIIGASYGIASVVGPVIGGVLSEFRAFLYQFINILANSSLSWPRNVALVLLHQPPHWRLLSAHHILLLHGSKRSQASSRNRTGKASPDGPSRYHSRHGRDHLFHPRVPIWRPNVRMVKLRRCRSSRRLCCNCSCLCRSGDFADQGWSRNDPATSHEAVQHLVTMPLHHLQCRHILPSHLCTTDLLPECVWRLCDGFWCAQSAIYCSLGHSISGIICRHSKYRHCEAMATVRGRVGHCCERPVLYTWHWI